MFVRSLKQPVRSGVYGMRGCIRGSSPSLPAALGSLRTCAQGAAAAIVGLLGSSLVRVRVSLPSGPGRAAASVCSVTCSRLSDIPATCRDEAGNPDIWVPENIDKEDGQRARCAQEVDALADGNPDIRVPEKLNRKKGLRAGCAKREEDAEGRGMGHERKEDSGGEEGTADPHLGERRPFEGRDDPSEGQYGPKKPEFRHVPGGTWLKQVRSCLRDRLRYMVGREEGGGDE
ncbi:hypothetical protein NDU88_003668 [Pleurodeles waltl]|uniref:Uncharacterized protein n=1 Tax=Pleurodeles waltl TaxID=8319 RepID=A0AAV7TP60_PLEWA|nr:hypothetical protein NDU88_003668 [Pleurodeles waltl]